MPHTVQNLKLGNLKCSQSDKEESLPSFLEKKTNPSVKKPIVYPDSTAQPKRNVFSQKNDVNEEVKCLKKQIKKGKKQYRKLQATYLSQQTSWMKERQNLLNQLANSRKKVQILSKKTQEVNPFRNKEKQQEQRSQRKKKKDQLVQCDLGSQQQQLDIKRQKRKIHFLEEKTQTLEVELQETKKELQIACLMITQLSEQLEPCENDQETQRGTQPLSQVLSSASNTAFQAQQIFSDEERISEGQEMNQQESPLLNHPVKVQQFQLISVQAVYEGDQQDVNSDCGVSSQANQDCSTVADSVSTARDFALPEWLQFDEVPGTGEDLFFYEQEFEDLQLQFWPELIWSRLKWLFEK